MRILNKLLTVTAALLLSGPALSLQSKDKVNNQEEASLKRTVGLTAIDAASQMGKGFNLGQMFENEQHKPSLVNAKAKIDAYYDRGFRNVRIPITWTETKHGDYLADPDTGKLNHDNSRLAALTRVIDYALSKKDLFVVINTHHEKDLKEHKKADVLANLWSDISALYKERNHRLIYEILNEPHLKDGSAMPADNLRHMTELAYNQIRKVEPHRILMIGGNQWFAAKEMVKTWPHIKQVGNGDDAYLMATFHHYQPWAFHGDGQGDFMDEWTNNHLSESMDIMLAWSKDIGHGMPIYIGEWGTAWQNELERMDCNNIRLWYSKFDYEYASPKGMPTAVWDDGGWFKIFDHNTNKFDNNLIDCIDGECAWSGTERFNAACK